MIRDVTGYGRVHKFGGADKVDHTQDEFIP
jgi:hypothetical protein